jgi:hypothetical protein
MKLKDQVISFGTAVRLHKLHVSYDSLYCWTQYNEIVETINAPKDCNIYPAYTNRELDELLPKSININYSNNLYCASYNGLSVEDKSQINVKGYLLIVITEDENNNAQKHNKKIKNFNKKSERIMYRELEEPLLRLSIATTLKEMNVPTNVLNKFSTANDIRKRLPKTINKSNRLLKLSIKKIHKRWYVWYGCRKRLACMSDFKQVNALGKIMIYLLKNGYFIIK